jgi:hypothetical protein
MITEPRFKGQIRFKHGVIQCCGAGAARSCIILVDPETEPGTQPETEPETQPETEPLYNAAPALTLNLLKGQKYNSFLLFPFKFVTILIILKSEEKVAPTLRVTLVCFQKVGLVNSIEG